MAAELILTDKELAHESFDIAQAIKVILPRGHVFHGYSAADNTRVMKILQQQEYSERVPILGYGEDGTAERALARAILSYAVRERDCQTHVDPKRLNPTADIPQVSLESNVSIFDVIVWGGAFKLYQEGSQITAWSEYSYEGYMSQPVEGNGSTPLEAIEELTQKWQIPSGRFSSMPPIALL